MRGLALHGFAARLARRMAVRRPATLALAVLMVALTLTPAFLAGLVALGARQNLPIDRLAPEVVAFVARFHMDRSVEPYEAGGFGSTAGRWLWVRPTFRLEGGSLVREPAADFDEFVRVQEQLVREEFGGRRMRPRETSVVAHWAREFWPAKASGSHRPRWRGLLPQAPSAAPQSMIK